MTRNRTHLVIVVGVVALVALGACGSDEPPPDPPAQIAPVLPVAVSPELLEAVGKTVDMAVRDTVILRAGAEIHVDHGQIRLVPNGDYVDLDDLSTFQVYVDELIFRVPGDQLVNGVDTEGTPIKNLSMHADGERLLKSGGDAAALWGAVFLDEGGR